MTVASLALGDPLNRFNRTLLERGYAWAGTAVLALALAIGLGGIRTLGLDEHEAYVVGSAQEMHDRGDWIIPWFNGEARLHKPPLSYWLTGAIAAAASSPFHVEPWHGRLPSVLAAVALAAITMSTARRLFDKPTAIVAGLVLTTSIGVVTYSHSARPEMLYAALCGGGVLAFVIAMQSATGRGATPASLTMWACFGLATLTKGPHIPAMLLVAFIGFLASRGGWRRMARTIQPLKGVLLLVAIAGPWWIAMLVRAGALRADGVGGNQLTGASYGIDPREALKLFYLYRPLQLILPWAVLLPALAAIRWRDRAGSDPARLMVWLVVTAAAVLTFGAKQRDYYFLPLVGPMVIVMAAGTTAMLRGLTDTDRRQWWWRLLLPIHALLVVGALIWIFYDDPYDGPLEMTLEIFSMVLVVAVGAVMAWRCLRKEWAFAQPLAIGLVFAVFFISAAIHTALWSSERAVNASLALTCRTYLTPTTLLLDFGMSPQVVVYATGHPSLHCGSPDEVLEALRGAGAARTLLLTREDLLSSLPPQIIWRILASTTPGAPGDLGDNDCLVELQIARGSMAPAQPLGGRVLLSVHQPAH